MYQPRGSPRKSHPGSFLGGTFRVAALALSESSRPTSLQRNKSTRLHTGPPAQHYHPFKSALPLRRLLKSKMRRYAEFGSRGSLHLPDHTDLSNMDSRPHWHGFHDYSIVTPPHPPRVRRCHPTNCKDHCNRPSSTTKTITCVTVSATLISIAQFTTGSETQPKAPGQRPIGLRTVSAVPPNRILIAVLVGVPCHPLGGLRDLSHRSIVPLLGFRTGILS